MASVFTRIINGELPGRFVWADDTCVAFLTANPLTDGHTLVVSRDEFEQWTDTKPQVLARMTEVARLIGVAQQAEWECPRVGLLAQGFEVPHVHLHVWPTFSGRDFDLRNAQSTPDPSTMDAAAARIRARLRDQLAGTTESENVPADPAA
ncbi:MAG: HIT family protein [Dermatophilus congolensis]|nr:HIT family protein [Dermatophilus congolensis]